MKNILVVRTDRIGDVVLTIPSLIVLRKHFPDARITVLVSPQTKDLVDGLPFLDGVMVDDRRGVHKGIGGFFRLIKNVKSRDFDCAVIYHTKRRTNLLCFLAGIPRRIGYKNDKFGFLLTDPIFDTRHEGKKHEAEYCLDILKAFDIHDKDIKLTVPVHDINETWTKTLFVRANIDSNKKVIAVNPGASDPSKCWPAEKFVELIKKITARSSAQFLLIGGGEASPAAKKICSAAGTSVFDLTGQTDVGQLVSLLRHCDLLISNDSGPVHIAAAVKTPVVSIFTRNQPGINPERWRPLSDSSRVVSVEPGSNTTFRKAGDASPEYLQKIPVGEVFEAVDALIKLC